MLTTFGLVLSFLLLASTAMPENKDSHGDNMLVPCDL